MVGGLAATGLGLGAGTTSGDHDSNGGDPLGDRLIDASDLRTDTATDLIGTLNVHEHEHNDDHTIAFGTGETEYRPFGYIKGTPPTQGAFYLNDASSADFLRTTLRNGSNAPGSFKNSERGLISPNSAFTFPTEGMDSWQGTMPPAPAADGDRTAGEMVDLYWMRNFSTVPVKNLVGASFNIHIDDVQSIETALGEDWWYDPAEAVFVEADLAEYGPYLSQFLIQDVMYGAMPVTPMVIDEDRGPFGTTGAEWNSIVSGEGNAAEPHPRPDPMEMADYETHYIHTVDDLATLVRTDPAYNHYLTATLFLAGKVNLDPGLAYVEDDNHAHHPYIDAGVGGVIDMLARVSRNALLAAWHHKWRVHLRLRPETYGGRVQHQIGGSLDFGISEVLTDSNVLDIIHDRNDSYFLPLAYEEGAPMHPAYPSGHSTIAGACGTVLKTYFENETWDFDFYETTSGGNDRETVSVDTSAHNGVYQEIDKLMSNIGLGRMFAGVHYYSDHIGGIKLGEQIAVATMYDHFESINTGDFDTDPTFTEYFDYDQERDISIATLETLRSNATTR